MKKILILTTGGTITSIPSDNGLVPTNTSEFLKKAIRDPQITADVENIMVLDSSNIQPEEWKLIAKCIYDKMSSYDGIIVTHGTDTMAYTASMMCFMIQNPSIPVVFTGSQLPITHPLTDAYNNLRVAAEMAKSNINGIFIAFDKRIIIGCRAVKVRTAGFAAFESINLKSIGKITANGLEIRDFKGNTTKAPILNTEIETNVFLLKLTPTTNPDIILLDINLPNMNGLQLLEAMREKQMKYSFTGCLIGPSMGCVCDGTVYLKMLDTVLSYLARAWLR